jgi:hypothetical protein
MHAQVEGKLVVQFDGQHVSGSGGQFSSDGATAGADFDHRASCEVAYGGRDMRWMASASTRKFWPSLGLAGMGFFDGR